MTDYSAFPRSANLVQRFTEVTALLANNATALGQSIDSGLDLNVPGSGFSKIRAFVFSDQPGTLTIDQSRDGTTWRTSKTSAVVASTGLTMEDIAIRQFVRATFKNTGGSTQTVFELDTALVAI